MGKRSAVREVVRRRLVAMPTGSVSATFPDGVSVEVSTLPRDIEEQLYRRVSDTIKRLSQIAIPTALQAEYKVFADIYNEIAAVNNEVIDYLQAHMYLPSPRLIQALIQLQGLANRYRERLSKVAAYLQKPMPALTELKPIPGLILQMSMGLGIRRRFSIR